MEREVLLSIQGITKTFPGVKALDGVDLEVTQGEIHGLVGENGAGKSTLLNIISGVFRPDQGGMWLCGQPFAPANPRQAQDRGIGFVHQETALCPHLSIAENIFLGRAPERSLSLIDFKQAEDLTAKLLREFHLDIDPNLRVNELNIAAQQVVEVLKALSSECRLLILDEPTSSLTESETETLFMMLKKLSTKGIGVLYISHRLAEVFRICDRVSVFRDGRYIHTKKVTETNPDEMITMMVGRSIDNLYPPKSAVKGEPLLRVESLERQGKFHDISFTVYQGEILGLAGLVGAGRTEVARAVCGIDRCDRGEVYLEGGQSISTAMPSPSPPKWSM
ncbi:ABC transporter family protein [Hydrogenispora ethanolica]|uniref:ABC transporter family protein n=1 Tax=Hydrogenispora ethanolica TaxID=1082276 RepID=A0A4R1RTL4_HYDET|nr:sugar ABC transporter ATP-binding protein [Hydrogenispora ethanolica]TCL69883.1 ABC transporter family protein [Hydrogenispora ethanolica]